MRPRAASAAGFASVSSVVSAIKRQSPGQGHGGDETGVWSPQATRAPDDDVGGRPDRRDSAATAATSTGPAYRASRLRVVGVQANDLGGQRRAGGQAIALGRVELVEPIERTQEGLFG